jgi:hypothetical protein
MDTLVLRNETLQLEFDQEYGRLIGVSSADGTWHLLDRPHLGLSFQLLVPLPGRRNNPVYGAQQKLAQVIVAPDSRSACFVWDKVTSLHGGEHPIRVQLDVTLTLRQAVFGMTIDNQSEFTVESAACPCLGDLQRPPKAEWFKSFLYSYATSQEWSLWPKYQNLRGYYGFDFPVQCGGWSPGCGAPMAPFILFRSQQQGLYMGVHRPDNELVAWHTELRPGYDSSIDSHMPTERTLDGKDVHVRTMALHLPYIQPKEKRSLTPVTLEIYQGDWQQGVDIYTRWRSSWMRTAVVPAWAREPHSWQQIHINSPEDELRMKFKDLVRVGEECARHRVKAVQLVGWNKGGQDQGNPAHDCDPRLGTPQELKDAIAAIRALGVKVVLFAKFTWADRGTPEFKTHYEKLAVKDPYGDYYMHQGYQYQTVAQMLDVNTKRLVPMCFLSEEYLRVCEEEFRKILWLGADGILFDECLHHSPALLCFDPHHGHRPGAMVYANDRELIHRLKRLADRQNTEFLFSGEACYEAYQLSYHRSEDRQHVPLSRYLLPDTPLMTAVTGFNDRNMLNQCLMYRYIVSYEPYNFKGRLGDFPLTLEYGKKMDALRTELRDFFWDGQFRHEVGAEVTGEGKPHHPYAVFINRKTKKRGLVICNYDDAKPVTVRITPGQAPTHFTYRLVDAPEWKDGDADIVIPPCSAVVVIEKYTQASLNPKHDYV